MFFTNYYSTRYMLPGTNMGQMIIEAWDQTTGIWCTNSPAFLPVCLQVMELARSTDSMSFYGVVGHNPPDAPFQVWNAGAGAMYYNITSDVPWLQISPSEGVSVSSADAQTHHIGFDTGGLGAGGIYSGQILISVTNGGGAASVIQVELEVGDSPEMVVSTHLLTNEVAMGYGATNGFGIRRISGVVPLAWTCSILEGSSWMSINPVSGTNTGEWDNVHVNFAQNIPAGANRGRILVEGVADGYGNPAIGSPQYIEVVAYGVEQPGLKLEPAVLNNRVLYGFDAPNQNIRIVNATGRGVLGYRISDNAAWLLAMQDSGVIERGAGYADVGLRYGTASLLPGHYEARVVVTAEDVEHGGATPGSPAWVDVVLDVVSLAELTIDRSVLEQQVVQGNTAAAQVFRVRNSAQIPRGVLAFHARVDNERLDQAATLPTWLNLSPASGVSAGEWADVVVSYNSSELAPGLYQARVLVNAADSGTSHEALGSPAELLVSLRVLRSVPGDFTGDNRTDLALYEESSGRWYVYSLTAGALALGTTLGGPGYVPVLGDFDGNGRSDIGVYRPLSGAWYARRLTEDHFLATTTWGGQGFTAIIGDYDGDGIDDFGVYDLARGLWYIRRVDGSILAWAAQWGGPGFVPVSGDYDGDCCSDLCAYDTTSGHWYITSLGVNSASGLIAWGMPWGGTGFSAMRGDFDGDGLDDLAVYQAATGNWYVLSLTRGVLVWAVNWGGPGYVPVLGDFDGDGQTDIAAYHEATGTWYARTASGKLIFWGLLWGGPGMQPM